MLSIPIIEQLSHKSNYGSQRSLDKIKYIVIHYTGNDGDKAMNNAKYFQTGGRGASAHYFVDDYFIYRSVPDNFIAWSVGGKKLATGGGSLHGICVNTNSISVEMCDTVRDGKNNVSAKTRANTIELVRELMQKYSIDINHVIRHYDVTGKLCPAYYASKNNSMWEAFKNDIKGVVQQQPLDKNKYGLSDFRKDVQKAIGVVADGIVGPKTIAALPTISKTKNNRHAVVKPLQNYLNSLGYECGSADGVLGGKTDTAIRQYQKKVVGTKIADGELTGGGRTWKTLLGVN